MNDAIQFVGALASMATLVGLGLALYQFMKAEKWKRAEFVAALAKELESEPRFQAIRKILDYRSTALNMARFGGRTSETTRITDEVLTKSLELPAQRRLDGAVGTAAYSDLEHDIRDCFDAFFDCLARFENHVNAGLVEHEQFRPYLGYWFALLGTESVHDAATLSGIRAFAAKYHPDALKFLDRFGVSFTPTHAQRALTPSSAVDRVPDRAERSTEATR